MNRHIDFDKTGGLYVYQDTFDFMQKTYTEPMEAAAALLGNKLILSGCVDNGLSVSAGWVVINNEILPFAGGPKATYVTIESVYANEQFDDGLQKTTYNTRTVKFTSVASGNYLWTDFKTLPYAATVRENATHIQNILTNLIFEAAVILSGCTVSNVSGSTLSIAAGICLIDGKYVTPSAYSGTFPVWLTPAGNYATSQPGSSYIKFDPHTSQHYKDVVKRVTTRSGEIMMSKVVNDRFDATTGIGKWEWLGFKLCAEMMGRFPVGYWFGASNLPTEVYQSTYRTALSTGGEKEHTLIEVELPSHTHPGALDIGSGNDGDYDSSGGGSFNRNSDTGAAGGNQPHENRPPYTVVAFIEKI